MGIANERIVVQTTRSEKKAIAAKARKLGLPISELMRRGAAAYESSNSEEELGILADAASAAAERASNAIDSAMDWIEASNKRIAEMEAAAQVKRPPRDR